MTSIWWAVRSATTKTCLDIHWSPSRNQNNNNRLYISDYCYSKLGSIFWSCKDGRQGSSGQRDPGERYSSTPSLSFLMRSAMPCKRGYHNWKEKGSVNWTENMQIKSTFQNNFGHFRFMRLEEIQILILKKVSELAQKFRTLPITL